jgi:hypothetical protein
MQLRRQAALGALVLLLPACVGLLEDPSAGERSTATNDLAFVAKVQVGDIILMNDSAVRGCWYLNKVENWYTDPRYCHAALVVERYGETGITTIEALNTTDNIQVLPSREARFARAIETKLAVLRMKDKEGRPLSEEDIQKVVDQALAWRDVKYVEPPIKLDGDPFETGLYCSMLPYRAYLDAVGIDLDASWHERSVTVPFFVTPDELYEARNSSVVFESAPQDPPTRELSPE